MGLQLKPGVVFGKEYEQLIEHCKANKFALPAVNVVGTNSINSVMEAAAKNKSDVIIQLSNGGAGFFAGQGLADKTAGMVLGGVSAAQHVHLLAEAYGVCVILHTDHANRKLLPWVSGLLDHGAKFKEQTGKPLFSSHMLDLSAEPLEDNLAECETFLKRTAALGMSLEIELGVTGGEEDGVGADIDEVDNAKLYTQPDEVLAAYDRLQPIGHFSVAAAFGNVHGVYKPGNVKLRPEILKDSQAKVRSTHNLSDENPLHLVFHGGSGSEPEKISEAIDYGVFKMNIDTDTQFAFAHGVGGYADEHGNAFKYQIDPTTDEPLKKYYDPRKWLREGEKSMVDRLTQAFEELRSTGKSVATA